MEIYQLGHQYVWLHAQHLQEPLDRTLQMNVWLNVLITNMEIKQGTEVVYLSALSLMELYGLPKSQSIYVWRYAKKLHMGIFMEHLIVRRCQLTALLENMEIIVQIYACRSVHNHKITLEILVQSYVLIVVRPYLHLLLMLQPILICSLDTCTQTTKQDFVSILVLMISDFMELLEIIKPIHACKDVLMEHMAMLKLLIGIVWLIVMLEPMLIT